MPCKIQTKQLLLRNVDYETHQRLTSRRSSMSFWKSDIFCLHPPHKPHSPQIPLWIHHWGEMKCYVSSASSCPVGLFLWTPRLSLDCTAWSPAAAARIASTCVHINARSSESRRGTIIFFYCDGRENFTDFLKKWESVKKWGGQNFSKIWIFQLFSKNIFWFLKNYFLSYKTSLI